MPEYGRGSRAALGGAGRCRPPVRHQEWGEGSTSVRRQGGTTPRYGDRSADAGGEGGTGVRVGLWGLAHPHLPDRVRGWRAAGWEVAGAWDADPAVRADFCRQLGVAPAEKADLLSAATGLVVVDAWPAEACALAAELIAQGKPVLLEKPGAPHLAAFAAVRAAAKAAEDHGGTPWLQMGYHFRYSPAVRRLRARLRSHALGRVSLVRLHGGAPAGSLPAADWLRPGERGGLLFGLGCHLVDLALWLWGPPRLVSCHLLQRARGPVARHGSEDGAAALWTYPDMLLTLDMSGWERQGYGAGWSIEAYGEYGEVLATLQPAALHATQRAPAPQRPCTIRQGWACAAVDLFTAEGRDVRERLRRGAPPPCGLAAGAAVLRLLDHLYRAAETGATVRCSA